MPDTTGGGDLVRLLGIRIGMHDHSEMPSQYRRSARAEIMLEFVGALVFQTLLLPIVGSFLEWHYGIDPSKRLPVILGWDLAFTFAALWLYNACWSSYEGQYAAWQRDKQIDTDLKEQAKRARKEPT